MPAQSGKGRTHLPWEPALHAPQRFAGWPIIHKSVAVAVVTGGPVGLHSQIGAITGWYSVKIKRHTQF